MWSFAAKKCNDPNKGDKGGFLNLYIPGFRCLPSGRALLSEKEEKKVDYPRSEAEIGDLPCDSAAPGFADMLFFTNWLDYFSSRYEHFETCV